MRRKDIDAAREARLWIRDIIIPLATLAVTTMAIPEVRNTVAAKTNIIKMNLKNKKHF